MWDTEVSSSATPFGRAHLQSSLLTMGLVQIERQHHRMHLLSCGISTSLASKFEVNREEREPCVCAHATSNVNVFYICIYRHILPRQKRIHCRWNCRSGGYKTFLQFGSPTAINIYKRCSRSSTQVCVMKLPSMFCKAITAILLVSLTTTHCTATFWMKISKKCRASCSEPTS